jgi:SAM-dependent methyltransferase
MERNSSLINITDSTEFKIQNLNEWKTNSDFWLEGNMRHIKDVKGKTIEILQKLLSADSSNYIKKTVIDEGCGEGWVYRALTEAKLDVNYYGIDFNEKFISELNKRYIDDENASFIKDDIEEKEINLLFGKADIVVNAFNFFEIPNLEKAMSNTSKLIKDGGYLVILTIDTITQLLSVSDNHKMFYEYLSEYANKKNRIGYKKRIVIGDKKTDKHYYGILYSLEDYLKEGRKNNLLFHDYTEILNPSGPTPQLYQFMIFQKKL